ncbi:MAG: oligosaccharide flippase family protein [Candidatus Pacebacteria bacterium]|jgi:O-antigen/teichoic acid export membrane protein|nr:oligosaccharide flippase family protein [Candidatus Paceibacterota bacterium]MBT3512202.1 oligosaccharide flippase family protein [Candidatus Paceibacterota bacterium]MBT4004568.1 oligosaccharide flippase family protein [Candidatus Paceibacterota bacterium]MBT4359184.1 oligosaccharide flippase family protein [Candidatus Paceibacterota bacterium]MBT4681070.1 oligosaccharide flippase family protein [Candidatus Paceibacterota bacterium]
MTQLTSQDTAPDLEEILDKDELQSIKKKTVSGAVSYVGRTAILQAIGLVSSLFLSAFLSPEDFGIYGFVVQIIGLLVFFSDIGLAAALVQKKSKPTLKEYRTAFTVQQILSWLIVAVVGIIISTGIVHQKTGQVGVWVLLSLAFSFPLATLKTIPSIKLERKLEFSKLVLPQIFEQVAFYSILVFLAWKGAGALAYAYAIMARSVIGVIVMSLIQPWKIGLTLNKKALKILIGYGAKFQLADFLARIKDQLFFLALGMFLPLKEFGYIQWAKTWSQYPYNLTVQNILAVTFPTFSRLQNNKEALRKAIEKSIFFITLAIFPILVGMSVFIKPLTVVVPSYAKWQPAIFSFILFTISIGWAALSSPLVNTLNAIGEINKTLKLMILWTVLTWIITPISISFFGFNGVSVAAFAISFTSFLPIIYVKKHVNINVITNIWPQFLASLVMGVVGWSGLSLWSQSLNWMLAGMMGVSLLYVLIVLMLGWKKIWAELSSLKAKVI